jgi:hypothetical protein
MADLVKYEPQAVAMPLGEVERLADYAAKSNLFGVKTREEAVTLMMLAQSEGLHPMQALRRFHIIKGKPAMRADAMQAEFQARGGTIQFHERSDKACDATFTSGATSVRVRWDMGRAKQADLLGNGTWQKYPAAMLHARCVSEGVRAVDPGVVVGIYTPEEVQDFTEEAKPRPVAKRAQVIDVEVVEESSHESAAPGLLEQLASLTRDNPAAIAEWAARAKEANGEKPALMDAFKARCEALGIRPGPAARGEIVDAPSKGQVAA